MAGIVVLSIMAVFSSPASACEVNFVKFYGTITDTDGDPYVGHEVEIQKQCSWPIQWRSMGSAVTDSNGYYEIGRNVRGYTFVFNENNTYRMLIDNNQVAQQYINDWDYDYGGRCRCISWSFWSYQWDCQMIPEFSTIALPVASILGLMLFFNYRKRSKQ